MSNLSECYKPINPKNYINTPNPPPKDCYKATVSNPMMNYLPFDKMTRTEACTDNLEELTGIPRIYTMPVTTSTQDSIAFAKSLYPDTSICRDTGYSCQRNADNTFGLDRLAFYPNDPYYQLINSHKI